MDDAPSLHPVLRRAQMSDAAEIARLATQLGYPATADEMSMRLDALLSRPEHLVMVAHEGGGLTGWIAVERRLLLEYGEKAEIIGLVVDARARRGGTGKALVAAAMAWAGVQGLRTLSVRSNIVRKESHPFYEGLGFIRHKTQHVYSRPL